MVYDWVQGRTLHLLALKNLDLETHFYTEMFPPFSIVQADALFGLNKDAIASYNNLEHKAYYNESFLGNKSVWFQHVYFHELMHSTNKYNGRYSSMWVKASLGDHEHIVGIEERIADLSALILCLRFGAEKFGPKGIKQMVYQCFEVNKTGFALPWQDVEDTVLCYVKNKDCPKLKTQLQYVKEIIMNDNLTTVYEGHFDAR